LNINDSDGLQSATLKGTGTIVTVSPSSLNFGKVTVGHQTADKTVTVTNASATTTLTITNIVIGGTNPGDFAIDGTSTCPIGGGSLSPSTSCTVLVNFTPTLTGSRSAKLNINDNGAGPNSLQTVSLQGTGQ
jgi:hypothetical protein